jgi:hypothetical protein
MLAMPSDEEGDPLASKRKYLALLTGAAMSDEFFPRDNRQPRHFWADNEVLDVYGRKLGAHGFAVYMALAKHAMNKTGECRTAISKIASQLGMSKGGVFNALANIVNLGLARRTETGDNRHCAVYVLADVKVFVDPQHAQLRLASVHTVNAKPNQRSSGDRTVHPLNSSVHPVTSAFIPRTRNKECKTFLQDLQNDYLSGPCGKCNNSGAWKHKGHLGRQVYCKCRAGVALRQQDEATV